MSDPATEQSATAHVIHKYTLPFKRDWADTCEVDVRRGKVLHLAMQHGEITAWVLVNQTDPLRPAAFRLVGTGGAAEPEWNHLGTVMEGPFVWHVFSEGTRTWDGSHV